MTVELWRAALLPLTSTVQAAIECLDRSGLQIVLVADDAGRLLGTITDGDVRRGLLRGSELSSPIAAIMHRDPLIVSPEIDYNAVLDLMRARHVHQLPVVDTHGQIVGLHIRDRLQPAAARTNVVVIMAGGKGMRLRPHTETCPKPMLPVGGKPMLEHIIERARADRFERFVIAVHYLGHMIEAYFGAGERWGVSIEYLREKEPLGTGGALSLLEHSPTGEPLLVTNGDVLTDVRYGEILNFHQRHGAAATMAVRSHEWQHPFGVVNTQGLDIVGFEEKPVYRSHVNAGIYVLEPSALSMLEKGEHCDMPTLFERLHAEARRTIAYPMHEPWLDVGRPDDLAQARSALA